MTQDVAGRERLVSLDVFRGATVAAMILVNNPGGRSAYAPLQHAEWHGWTPTDLVFPFFLFTVGVAVTFSQRATFARTARRALTLVGLGLLLAAYPRFEIATLRWPGVLQRIGLCYLLAWLLRRRLGPRGLLAAIALLLVGYAWLLTRVPVPGGGPPSLEPAADITSYVDRLLMSGHMGWLSKRWDPEGLVSTAGALATTLFGVLAGAWLPGPHPASRKAAGLLAGGFALVIVGLTWGAHLPLNKNLWMPSFAVATAGLAAYLLGLCHLVADAWGRRAWATPFVAFGANAILAFVGDTLVRKTLGFVTLAGDEGARISLRGAVYEGVFARAFSPPNAALAYASAHVLLWALVLALLHGRRLYWKV